MLNVVAGRLAKDPEIFQRKTEKGTLPVSNNTIYLWDGKNGKGIPIKITAWGQQAKEMMQYNKGDYIHFVGAVQEMEYQPEGCMKPIRTIGYSVRQIDPTKSITAKHDALLRKYMEGEKVFEDLPSKEKKMEGDKVKDSAKEKAKTKKMEEPEKPLAR